MHSLTFQVMRLNLGTLYHKKYWRITADFYEEKRKGYRGKQNEINDKMSKLHTADEEYYLTVEYILNLATKASELFESSEPQEKRLLLKMTLQNLVMDGKYIRFDWIKPFDKMAYFASRQAWLPEMYRPRNWFLENIEAWKNAWDISLQPTFNFYVN